MSSLNQRTGPMRAILSSVLLLSLGIVACDSSDGDDGTESNPVTSRAGRGATAAGNKSSAGRGGKSGDDNAAGKGGDKSEHQDAGSGGKASGGRGGKAGAGGKSGSGASGKAGSGVGGAGGKSGSSAGGKAGSGAGTGGQAAVSGSGGEVVVGPGPGYDEAACEACESASMVVMCSDFRDACFNATGSATAGPKAGTHKSDLCKAVVDCFRNTGCGASDDGSSLFWSCYCGRGRENCWQDTTLSPEGLCKSEIEAATETTELSALAPRWSDQQYASGNAAALFELCDTIGNCSQPCGFCIANATGDQCQPAAPVAGAGGAAGTSDSGAGAGGTAGTIAGAEADEAGHAGN